MTGKARRPAGGRQADLRRITRARLIAFMVVVVLILAGAAAYLVHEHSQRDKAIRNAPPVATTDLAPIEANPRIVFRSNSRAHYGVIAMVALADPSGARGLSDTSCDRVYSTQNRLLCVSLDHIAILYQAQLLDSQLRVTQTLPLAGIPSRARLSADGRLAATTAFANVGDSYTTTNVSTRTYITTAGSKDSVSLEDFTLMHDGQAISPVDRNYWGVTFAADDVHFYATVAFSGQTWLVRGDLSTRTVTTLRSDVECPSLSPDGTHLVYKKRLGQPAGHWRLTALDIASGVETPLAETRSVDDQVEWLDNNHVLYAIPGSGGDPDISDVYVVPADGSGAASVLIREASSPAVVR